MLSALWNSVSEVTASATARLASASGAAEEAPAEPEIAALDALAVLESEASVASDALATFSATLRQQSESADARPIQSMQFALPHQELQYLQLLEQRSEKPVMPGKAVFAEAQRAARDIAALEALRSTQQEMFAQARAGPSAEGVVSEFLTLALSERSSEEPSGAVGQVWGQRHHSTPASGM